MWPLLVGAYQGWQNLLQDIDVARHENIPPYGIWNATRRQWFHTNQRKPHIFRSPTGFWKEQHGTGPCLIGQCLGRAGVWCPPRWSARSAGRTPGGPVMPRQRGCAGRWGLRPVSPAARPPAGFRGYKGLLQNPCTQVYSAY